ncbi:MAG: hypothetical protein ACRD6X_14615, partial [Pyrinomonadaceae bacterium]
NLEVLDNTDTALQIRSNNGNVTLFINGIFQLFDDDDFNDDDGPPPFGDGTLDGDDQEDIECLRTTPNCFDGTFSLLQVSANPNTNVFSAAYLEPEYEWARQQGFNQSNLSFVAKLDRNNNNGDSLAAFFNPFRNSRNANGLVFEKDDFWVGYVVIGYQSGINPFLVDEDGDPFSIGIPGLIAGGFSPAVNIDTDLVDDAGDSLDVFAGSIGSAFFIEGMSDLDRTVGASVNNWKNRIPPHELGHQLGLRGDVLGFGIMTPTGNSIQLVPRHIGVIRWRVASPGEPNF